MRTLLLTTALLVLGHTVATAQQKWLFNDHRWTFHIRGGFIGLDDYFTQKVDKDTTFWGTPCKKITFEGNTTNYYSAPFLAYEDNRRLYLTHPYDSLNWYIAYDFNLAPNDFFNTQYSNHNLFKVDFYDVVNVDGVEVTRQRLLALNPSDSTETGDYYDVLEGIGNVGHWDASEPSCSDFNTLFAPFCESFVDGFDRRFICFSSNALQYAPYAGCTTSGTNNPQHNKPEITVGPNPVHDLLQLRIEGDNAMQAVRITDVQGRVLIEQAQPDAITWNVHLGDLPAGMYMLNVRCTYGTYTQLLVKN